MQNNRILVVDDEPKLVRLVREVLEAANYEVFAASSGEQAIETIAIEQPDLVILDIILLGSIDGYQTASRIREYSSIPIIILTAKGRESDMLLGFDAGADDYITKPFSSKELLARVRAVLARAKGSPPSVEKTEIICADIRINLLRHQVFLGDREVHLTPTEYKLLVELAKNKNRVLLHEEILGSVWGSEYRDDIDYLRAYIHYLRRKLEPDPANPRFIISSPGVGYMLQTPE